MIRAFSRLSAPLLALNIAPASAMAQDFSLRSETGAAFNWATPSALDTALGFVTRQTWQGQMRLMWCSDAGALQLVPQSSARQGVMMCSTAAQSPLMAAQPVEFHHDRDDQCLVFR